MPQGRLLVVGGGAGALPALVWLLSDLPRDLACPVVVVLHRSTRSGGAGIAHILRRASALPVVDVTGPVALLPAHVYLGPASVDTWIEAGRVVPAPGLHETHQSALDLAFRSAARSWGRGALGMVLSGESEDGVAGLGELRDAGGTILAQEPETAQFPELPRAALRDVGAHLRGGPAALARAVVEAVAEEEPEAPAAPVRGSRSQEAQRNSPIPCPECGGPLGAGSRPGRRRCSAGHEVDEIEVLAARETAHEHALAAAISALEDIASLAHDVAARRASEGSPDDATRFGRMAQRAQHDASLLRALGAWPDPIRRGDRSR